MPRTTTLTIRTAHADDRDLLDRLAALDETAALALPALIAEHDGHAVAAISLADRRVASDPFAYTADTVSHLQMRVTRLHGKHTAPRRPGPGALLALLTRSA